MKRVYEKPMMICDVFTADEYVAACGDVNTHYEFVCDAASFNIGDWGVGGSVYMENGKEAGLQVSGDNKDQELGLYYPCSATHAADMGDDFHKGYLKFGSQVKDVMVWRGADDNNVHCTTNLQIDTWETTKS